jgi:hypothetical protein
MTPVHSCHDTNCGYLFRSPYCVRIVKLWRPHWVIHIDRKADEMFEKSLKDLEGDGRVALRRECILRMGVCHNCVPVQLRNDSDLCEAHQLRHICVLPYTLREMSELLNQRCCGGPVT